METNHSSLFLLNRMKLLQTLKTDLDGVFRFLSLSDETGKSGSTENNATFIRVTFVASLTTLLLNVIAIIGSIWRLFDMPIYGILLMISICAFFFILLVLTARFQSRDRLIYILVIALIYSIIIIILLSPFKDNTIHIPYSTL
jgi:hypothetical protein